MTLYPELRAPPISADLIFRVTEKVTRLTFVKFRMRFLIKGEILSGFCVSGIFEFKYVLDLPKERAGLAYNNGGFLDQRERDD